MRVHHGNVRFTKAVACPSRLECSDGGALHRYLTAEVMVWNPVQALIFLSILFRNGLSCEHNCEGFYLFYHLITTTKRKGEQMEREVTQRHHDGEIR